MKSRSRVISLAIVMLGLFCLPAGVEAHTVFKKFISTKYTNLQVKCEACHIKGKDKEIRNEFGELFYKQLKSQELTKKWKSLKGKEKQAYEKEVMVPAFEKALEEVKKQKNAKEQVYGELIAKGEIENMGIKKEGGEDDDDDDDDDDRPETAAWEASRKLVFTSP
jgi:hypothetical protein